MQCPFCQHTDSRVLESRSAESGRSIRRRRECLSCTRRFTTYERIEFVPITILKRDGQRESFDRSKLLRGIVTACFKTGIPAVRLEALVDDIEADLQLKAVREVTSTEVGEAVLKALKQLSEVAYVRFASVYRQFQGIRDFVEEMHSLQPSSPPLPTTVHSPETSGTPPAPEVLSLHPPESDPTDLKRPSVASPSGLNPWNL